VDVGGFPRGDFGFGFGDVAGETNDGVGGVAGEVAKELGLRKIVSFCFGHGVEYVDLLRYLETHR
jgi:hypothetical protein